MLTPLQGARAFLAAAPHYPDMLSIADLLHEKARTAAEAPTPIRQTRSLVEPPSSSQSTAELDIIRLLGPSSLSHAISRSLLYAQPGAVTTDSSWSSDEGQLEPARLSQHDHPTFYLQDYNSSSSDERSCVDPRPAVAFTQGHRSKGSTPLDLLHNMRSHTLRGGPRDLPLNQPVPLKGRSPCEKGTLGTGLNHRHGDASLPLQPPSPFAW